MNDLIRIFSCENLTILSSWTDGLYCSFEEDGTITLIEKNTGYGPDQWFDPVTILSTPRAFSEVINRIENLCEPCINGIISILEKSHIKFSSELEPESQKESESNETLFPEAFVVPDHLIAGVAEVKEIHPDAAEERLANFSSTPRGIARKMEHFLTGIQFLV